MSNRSSGIGCLTVIQIVLVLLKLLDIEPVGSWTWWVVLIPLWIDIVVAAILLMLAGIIMLADR